MNYSTIHPIDAHVGASIRARRKELHLSMIELGNVVGITYQQVQKYELGVNRVSASKLHQIAEALCVPVASFFPANSTTEAPAPLVLDPRERDIVMRFRKLRTDQRKALESMLANIATLTETGYAA
jgi:transcriptional regulator with XRE-family HTH domain